jgi:hypothetical protein
MSTCRKRDTFLPFTFLLLPFKTMTTEKVHQLRAIEALRAGVPNRDVVRWLPPHQSEVEERFEALLEATAADSTQAPSTPGLLLEGDFGAGKSHWLERLEHRALESNFVCSSVVLNKETPLHDLNKIYRAAVEAARVPGKKGPALTEIAHTYRAATAPGYRPFFEWIHHHETLDSRYAATLHVFERSTDEELQEKVIAEWTGYPMYASDLKAALKELGETSYKVARPERGRLLQRFEFLARFFRSAGYGGWVVLLDETEMISKYSLRQRGQSYAHLAQLLGLDKNARVPGLATVFTITKDYAGQVLHGRKNDLVSVPAKMQGGKDDACVAPAQIGMKAIQRQGIDLRPPTREQVDAIYEKTRELYGGAYDWPAPDLENRREYSTSTGLRQYLRSWINTWDLRRLYDYQADTVVEPMNISYEEDTDLQTASEDGESFITL